MDYAYIKAFWSKAMCVYAIHIISYIVLCYRVIMVLPKEQYWWLSPQSPCWRTRSNLVNGHPWINGRNQCMTPPLKNKNVKQSSKRETVKQGFSSLAFGNPFLTKRREIPLSYNLWGATPSNRALAGQPPGRCKVPRMPRKAKTKTWCRSEQRTSWRRIDFKPLRVWLGVWNQRQIE